MYTGTKAVRHDRANDKGNFNWMNTLLTIIKGSVFNQYAFHNASAMPLSSYGAHCFTHRTFCCLPAFWCFSIRIISFLFSQFGHKKWKNEHSMHEKSIKLYSYTSLCYATAPNRPKRWCWINLCCSQRMRIERPRRKMVKNTSGSGTTPVFWLILAFFRPIRFGFESLMFSRKRDLEQPMCARRYSVE